MINEVQWISWLLVMLPLSFVQYLFGLCSFKKTLFIFVYVIDFVVTYIFLILVKIFFSLCLTFSLSLSWLFWGPKIVNIKVVKFFNVLFYGVCVYVISTNPYSPQVTKTVSCVSFYKFYYFYFSSFIKV